MSSKPVVNRSKGDGTKVRVNECVVGDDTGVVVFTAKNDQGKREQAAAYEKDRNPKPEGREEVKVLPSA